MEKHHRAGPHSCPISRHMSKVSSSLGKVYFKTRIWEDQQQPTNRSQDPPTWSETTTRRFWGVCGLLGTTLGGEEQGASMRELGLVTAQVLAVLRPQIQEEASAPQLVAGGFCKERAGCQREERALLRQSTFPQQQLCGRPCNGNQ